MSGKKPPRVSVIIPYYNGATLLPRAVNSVLEQTFTDFELLIVDDCSNDDTPEVASSFLFDPRVRCFRHDENLGPSAARNTGIRNARGEFIAFLDSDDWWDLDKLSPQVQTLQDDRYAVCAARAYRVGVDGLQEMPGKPSLDRETLYKNMLFGNVIPGNTSVMMVRRDCFSVVGLFNEGLQSTEDYDLWLRLAAYYQFVFMMETRPLVYFDKSRPVSWTSNLRALSQGIEAYIEKRERDILEPFRYLLPSVRRSNYLFLALRFLATDDLKGARRYAWMAVTASTKADRQLRRSLVIVFLSFVPLSVQRRIFGWLRVRLIGKN